MATDISDFVHYRGVTVCKEYVWMALFERFWE